MVCILLIDRDRNSSAHIQSLLSGLNVNCIEYAGSAPTMVHPRFDAVLVGNPGLNPMRRAVTLPARALKVPVIHYFSSDPGPDHVSDAIMRGASEVLIMPFDAQLLAFKLEQVGVRMPRLAA